MAAVKGQIKKTASRVGKRIPQLQTTLPRGKAVKMTGRIRRGRA